MPRGVLLESAPEMRRVTVVFSAMLLPACVVTTHEGPSEPPRAPSPPVYLAPEPSSAAAPGAGAAREPSRPESIAASHVLVQYRGAQRAGVAVTRSKEAARARAEEVVARARGGESFPELVAAYSDEPGAAERGGSLGRFRAHQMVPEFSDAAFALDVGEISDVVESAFGFHVIRRDE